jgi:ERF superfamily
MSDTETAKPPEHRFSNSKETRQEILALAAKPDEPKPLTLAQKIHDIQKNVPTVKKKGYNSEHRYKFLQIEDAVLAVNKMLSARNLILTQNLRSWETAPHTGGKGYIAKVMLEWTLEDVGTTESRTYLVPGEGYDTTDKGTPKAITASRKQAIITIFNLPVGDNPEANSFSADREDAKAAAKAVGDRKLAEAAGRGSQTAIDALTQVEPEKKIVIGRPEEHNGNYIVVSGFIAAPPLEKFFDDTASKRFKTKADLVPYWRVPAEYEKGLVTLCQRLGIEVEG